MQFTVCIQTLKYSVQYILIEFHLQSVCSFMFPYDRLNNSRLQQVRSDVLRFKLKEQFSSEECKVMKEGRIL